MNLTRIGNHDLPLPQRSTDGAAGYDLQAAVAGALAPGERQLVPTGWAWAIPLRMAGLVLPRSGIALRAGVTVANAPGLIDPDYRGEVKVILVNHGKDEFRFEVGDRIAQLMLAPYFDFNAFEVPSLDETARGAGGFGSTGV